MSKLPLEEVKKLAKEILDRQTDLSVRLVDCTLDSAPPYGEALLAVETTFSLAARVEDGAVVCASKYEIAAHQGNVDTPPTDRDRFQLSVLMHGQWLVESTEGLTADHAKAFALAVGAMTLHPYVRSQAQALTTAAGYPPFTLGVLPSLLAEDEAGEVDLGDIAADID